MSAPRASAPAADDGRRRVFIENVFPAVDHGRFPIVNRVPG